MKKASKVSVVTITYNDVSGIQDTIESVLNQTHPADEYIVIDGGSTDGTKEVIEKYKDYLSYFSSEPDNGIYDAMNKGWQRSSPSNFIIYCNSSDRLEKNAVFKFMEAVRSHDDDVDIFHGMLNFTKRDQFLYVQGRDSNCLNEKMIEHPATFVKKEVFESLNGFDTTYKSAADYDFMLRAKLNNFKFKFFPEIISNFDTSGVSSTSSTGQVESLKIRKNYKFISRQEYSSRVIYIKLKKLMKDIVK